MRQWKKLTAAVLALGLLFSVPAAADTAGPRADDGSVAPSQNVLSEPVVQAEGAVVIDAATGKVLWGKNETSRFYPASITKLMTALIVLERSELNDMVTFSETATTNLESGATNLNLTQGDQLTVEQCLYGLLLKSANEIGNGLAEHVAGSVEEFAKLMNQKATQLGCTGTHFANPHGLNDSNHYTTPLDMAKIGAAAFENKTLCKIDTTISYQFPATRKNSARTITMGHKMMYPDDARYYEGIIGGKTGYTSLAGSTLVTGAERDGVRLVAVVMKSQLTHYDDTRALLDYGFARMKQEGQGGGTGPDQSGNTQAKDTVVPGAAPRGPESEKTGWVRDERGWYYLKSDLSRAAGEWLKVDGTDYWIDSDGYMATGWRKFTDGSWYYFRSDGAMAVSRWVMDNEKWFYLGSQGAMLVNTRTPDGYQLGTDGAWIP
ncbi:MAG: D-alanyl-D-alanine carboxypeptidase [Hungatella sp.]|nr:D-alanyl-D-alanine carboxypeptidase [Hungatella sp.]